MYAFIKVLLHPFPFLVLAIGVVVVYGWVRREGSSRRRWVLTFFYLLLLAITNPITAYLALATLEWRYPPQDPPPSAQAIVVLAGGAEMETSWRPYPVVYEGTLHRCLHAAAVYRAGEPCPVIVAGGPEPVDPAAMSLADAMGDLIVRHGVRRDDMVLEEQSTSTHENAVYGAKLLSERGISRIVLVTDAAHMTRSERCFRRQGLEVIPSACRYRADQLPSEAHKYLPDLDSVDKVHAAFREWLGLLWYWMHDRV